MKGFNIKSRWPGLWEKGIKALLLLLICQGCPKWEWGTSNRGEAYQIAIKTPLENFHKELEEKLSNNDPTIFKDKIGQNVIYLLVKHSKHKKLLTFLLLCSKKSDPSFKKNFIETLNTFDKANQETPLGASITNGNVPIFNLLRTQEGIDINKAGQHNGQNVTSLILALKKQILEMVSSLLKDPNIDITTPDPSSGNTPLHLAISNTNSLLEMNRKNWLKIVETLIRRLEKEAPSLLSAKNKNGDTPLHLAISNKIESIVSLLVNKLPRQHLEAKNDNGETPLLLAVTKPPKEGTVASLINKLSKEALGVQNNKSQTPLQLALELNKNENIALLLIDALPEEGLRVKNKESVTPIYSAIKYNLNRAVAKLVDKLSAINDFYVTDQKGKGLLHIACRSNNLHAFEQIFEKVCNLSNTKDTVTRLFHKDRHGYTVFASSYLPKNKTTRWIHISDDNFKMFQDVLSTVKDNLNGNQWQDITNEINALTNNKTIKIKDANKLHEIVKKYTT